jgi:predicted TIM-barrel fold metal-dependent hydrolase
MKSTRRVLCAALTFLLSSACGLGAQAVADSGILAEINRIRAIDNHAHPLPVLSAGEKDTEFDVPDSIPPLAPPVRLRPTNPEYLEAWRMLYGYRYRDFSAPHLEELLQAKQEARRARGDAYPRWVLDQLGIETMLANRLVLGTGLTTPRFLWVWHANPLLFPLNNEDAKKSNPQRRAGFENDELFLKGFLSEVGFSKRVPTLDQYVSKVVIPLLQRRKREGAVAVKFYAAYMRSLDFAAVPEDVARSVYSKYVGGTVPTGAEYKSLQDFLFRRIALECGRLGLAVHIHVGVGSGRWFYNTGASPFLLESVLNDPDFAATTFVLVHGGLPFAQATRVLLSKPNVYADFSSQTFLTTARELSQVLRSWLELRPEKVLFGTDAYPLTTAVGWEEIGWLAINTARQALALALTGMMQDGEITRERASELARMVMRENAIRLYGLTPEKK